VLCGKAEVLELNHQIVHTPSMSIHCPSVIRLSHIIRRPQPRARLSRREIFIRDNYTCQYCGVRTRDLTLDHVIPRSKGGPHTWENLVSACKNCNHRKGGKTIAEARMPLARAPKEPKANVYHMIYRYMENGPLDEWLLYLPGMQKYQQYSASH
jgi:5-methylcytosine-specific restriction endonuclease McrA